MRSQAPRPSGRPRALLLAALLAAVATPAAAQRADTIDVDLRLRGRDVVGLTFEGVHAFTPAQLRTAIETTAGTCGGSVLAVLCPFGLALHRQPFDPDMLRADAIRLRLFYYQRGYRDARIGAAARPAEGGVHVVITVDEGQPVRVAALEILGADTLQAPPALGDLPLRVGEPLNMLAYEATRDTIRARLRNRGYAHAEVFGGYDIPQDPGHTARVQYEVAPGGRARFDTIQVVGATHISPAVVRRMLTVRPGDVYSEAALLRSQRNLFSLEAFRHVEVGADLDAQPDTLVPVTVSVTEGDLHRVRVGVGINNVEAINAEGRWTSRNFLGGGRRLEVRGQISNVLASQLGELPGFAAQPGDYGDLTGSLGVDFVQPWFFSPLNTFGAGLFLERRSIPGVYIREGRGGYLTLSRAVGTGATASLGYRMELTRLRADQGDLYFCTRLVACELSDIQVLSSAHRLAPLTIGFARDRSNSLFAPTRGSIVRLEGELAGRATGSEFSYLRLVGELSEYRRLSPGLVLATRIRPGWARALGEPTDQDLLGLHPQKRFFAGGPNSVRGFAQYRLGPKVLTVHDPARTLTQPDEHGVPLCSLVAINAGTCDVSRLPASDFDPHPVGGSAVLEGNAELRFPLGFEKLRGAAFVDVGQVWARAGAARLGSLVWTPGFGVRYFSAIGPIRVDIGFNPQGAERLAVLSSGVGVRATDPATGDTRCVEAPAGTTSTDYCELNKLHAFAAPHTWQPYGGFLDRLQLHFSIGQAF